MASDRYRQVDAGREGLLMADHVRLAANNATDRELAIAEAVDVWARLGDDYARVRSNDLAPAPEWLPYLAAEYGLGELIPYVPDLARLIAVGPDWQRKRGTPGAVRTGLSWVGYTADLEWALARRRRWHLWQMKLSRLPDSEHPDLDRIDGIASLSDDATSHFWRGFRGFDVRPIEMGNSRWGSAMWGSSSGVRIQADGALWSFGRASVADRTITEAELAALGAWIPPAGASEVWSTMDYAWDTADYPWSVPGSQARRETIAKDLAARQWHVALRAVDGALIGVCRAKVHAVAEAPGGAYAIGSTRWSPSTSPTALLVRGVTPFSVPAAGSAVASIGLLAGAAPASGVLSGKAWFGPSEMDLAACTEIVGLAGLDVTLAATCREIITIILRID